MMLEKYSEYWKDKDVPLHRFDTEEHYQEYAKELRLLFEGLQDGAVLELGCGNGALYPYLGFDRAKPYVGVDFSPAMIKSFSSKHPQLELHCADASAFAVDRKFDLIFSNGMIQNFDEGMLDRHFANARSMLAPNGVFICASYPTKPLRFSYFAGESGSNPLGASNIAAIVSYFRPQIMGRWYSAKYIAQLAQKHGLEAKVFGSMYYRYRNHAVMRAK